LGVVLLWCVIFGLYLFGCGGDVALHVIEDDVVEWFDFLLVGVFG